jgi:hypothetical protein
MFKIDNGHMPVQPLKFQQNKFKQNGGCFQQNGSQTQCFSKSTLSQRTFSKTTFSKKSSSKLLTVLQVGQFFPSS